MCTKALGYQRAEKAKKHLRDSQFNGASASIAAELGQQGGKAPTLITESGLYRLVLKSDAKNADRFQDWVTAKSFRRTGCTVSQVRNSGSS